MKLLNHFKDSLLPILMVAMALISCEESANVGGVINEFPYEAAVQLNGLLLDKNTNKNSSVVEMGTDGCTTQVVFRLSQPPAKGVDVQIAYDETYATVYNALHQTDFDLFPSDHVDIEFNGTIVLAPDDLGTTGINVKLTVFDDMEENKTYLVPLTATSPTSDVFLSEESKHMVLLVKLSRASVYHEKNSDVQTVLYFEVNDTNPLNALEFKTASGKYFFDHIVLFAANINWDDEKKRVYIWNNENVQYLLDNQDKYLAPLRKAGMKIIISILGNHDSAGIAQLSEMGSRELARELAAYCKAYNLDGVAFDDEYSNYPDLNNPWFTVPSVKAGSRLMYECKRAMPDKIVSLYCFGNNSMYSKNLEIIEGVDPGQYCDYAVGDYGDIAEPGIGMTLSQCSYVSIQLRKNGSNGNEERDARKARELGYGYHMFFALCPTQGKPYNTQINRCQDVCRGLYDEELLFPKFYYEKNRTERLPL